MADSSVPVTTAVDRRLFAVVDGRLLPGGLAALAFALLFWAPSSMVVHDWLYNADSSYGLLLALVAVFLAYRSGLVQDVAAEPRLGLVLLVVAVLLRVLSGIASEWFTMRCSELLALIGITVFLFGRAQLKRWWLPLGLLLLSIPLPGMILGALARPLQFQASAMGAALMRWRHVPVLLEGNVIRLPHHALFVTEACSGLRSLTALLSLGLLIGGLWLRSPALRLLLLLLAIPTAMILNGFRIFLTGFLVYYVDPALGEGLMHYTEGWVIFAAAFAVLGGMAYVLFQFEQWKRAPV